MALTHAAPGQALSVAPFGAELAQQRTHAIFKSRDLEVMRLVLAAGKSFPEHQVPGEITLQCLEGTLEVQLEGRTQTVQAGELLFVPGGVRHGVRALRDASALLTIALR